MIVKFIYENEIKNIFMIMPPFKNWFVLFLSKVNFILDIRDARYKITGLISCMFSTVKKVFGEAKALDRDVYHLHDLELIPIGLKFKKLDKQVIFDAHEDVPKQLLGKLYLNKPLLLTYLKLLLFMKT